LLSRQTKARKCHKCQHVANYVHVVFGLSRRRSTTNSLMSWFPWTLSTSMAVTDSSQTYGIVKGSIS
jgi:hypothetical protein